MTQEITLENCEQIYRNKDGSVTIFSCTGQMNAVIRQLMERYFLPPKRLWQELRHSGHDQWGGHIV